jgi:hypothetical protein
MTFLSRTLVVASFATLFLFAPALDAQLRQPGSPAAAQFELDPNIPTAIVPAPAHDVLLAQEAFAPIGPLRFGVPLPVHIDVTRDGAFEVTPDDRLVFRGRIESPDAFSLGLEFDTFQLPQGGQFFIYDDALTHVYGAYDRSNTIPTTGEFVIEPFPGSSVVWEYSQPLAAGELARIVIRSVIHDYKDVFELERQLDLFEGFGEPKGSCPLVDVNCPEGDPFPNQKRATVRTVFSGGLCSASLINNTLSDGTRYVYTANHCGQGTTTVFRFNYQRSGCSAGSAPTNQNVSGAVVLANDTDTDGRLLRITSAIPANFNPYFAGWSRSTANLTFGMSMHHPGGGVKKISIDTNGGGQTSAGFIGIGTVKCWSMNFQTGSTEGGSSGGPLFDQSNRIRGTLTGGPDGNCGAALYGRFHNFWLETSIAQFLDPNGSGATAIDGFDPVNPATPPVLTSLAPSSVEAFGPEAVTLTGTGFAGATIVTVNGVPLGQGTEFTIVDDTTITITPPTPVALGAVDVVVTSPAGSSGPQSLTYVETQPLTLTGPLFIINGTNVSYAWGGKANQIAFLNVAATNTTVNFMGQPFLLYLISVPMLPTSAAGLGGLTAPVTGAPLGANLFTQILTIAPPGTNLSSIQLSNVHSALVIG